MRLIYCILFVILLNLSVVLGSNKISLELDKTVYPPFGELKGMCLLKLDSQLDLGADPKIKLSIGTRKEERNVIDLLKDLDPNLDLQESTVNLTNAESQKTLNLNNENFFGFKLLKNSEIKNIDFDIDGINGPNSPYIQFNDQYIWYYPGVFQGWSNDVIGVEGLTGTRSSEDIIVRDNIFLYCGLLNLPFSNKFNVSAEYSVQDNSGNISLQLFEFEEETKIASNKKGECTLRNSQGELGSCLIETSSYLSGDHLVCFYNRKNEGNYLLSLDDEGQNSFECDSELLDNNEAECSYVEEGDFFIKSFKPVFQGELNNKVTFNNFSNSDFAGEITDYLTECKDDNGECNVILKTGTQNNDGKLRLSNINIEYIKSSGGSSFVSRKIYDTEFKHAKVLSILGKNFVNYSLEIPLEVFDNFTIPNITSNFSTKTVKITLGNLNAEEDIEVNKNIVSSAQDFIDITKTKFERLKNKTELTDFYNIYGLDFGQQINKLNEFKTNLNTLNNNANLGLSEKSTEAEKINEEARNYIKTFPQKIDVLESVEYPRIFPETINPEILGSNNEDEILAIQEEVIIDTKIKLVLIETFNGTSTKKTFIKKKLSSDLKDYFIIEEISKNIAQNAGSIKLSTGASVVKDDPVIKWHFTGSGEIGYVVEGDILGKLDKINTIILPSFEDTEKDQEEFKESVCGDGVCTEILEDKLICPEDCKPKYNINWTLIAVLFIILILGIIYFNFFMNKIRLREIVVKKYPFLSSTDEANLKNYVSSSLKKGVPRATIYKILLQKKWSKEQIDYIFKKVQPPESKLKFIFDLLKKK